MVSKKVMGKERRSKNKRFVEKWRLMAFLKPANFPSHHKISCSNLFQTPDSELPLSCCRGNSPRRDNAQGQIGKTEFN
jgi:hypothetical protein